jgi:antitoxin component of MazEF toxin-antitoxin module
MNETYRIRNVGGSLMVVLPQQIVRDMALKAGDEVIFRRAGSSRVISVEPLGKPKRNGAKK